MHIEKYLDLESVMKAATIPEREYIFERHELKAGEDIFWHFHTKAEEIIIIYEGAFWLAVEEKRHIIQRKKKNEVKVIYIYPGEKHALLAVTDVFYAVYKTQADEIIRCKGPSLKAEWKKIPPAIRQIAPALKKKIKQSQTTFKFFKKIKNKS